MGRREVLALGAIVALAACGGGGSAAGASPARTAAGTARGSANVIVAGEVEASGATNAMEAIRQLHPAMLRGRGSAGMEGGSSADLIVVYVDNIKAGGLDALVPISAINIREIRFLSAADATTRFGTGTPSGAILVTTKK
jgi:hypothetical protein